MTDEIEVVSKFEPRSTDASATLSSHAHDLLANKQTTGSPKNNDELKALNDAVFAKPAVQDDEQSHLHRGLKLTNDFPIMQREETAKNFAVIYQDGNQSTKDQLNNFLHPTWKGITWSINSMNLLAHDQDPANPNGGERIPYGGAPSALLKNPHSNGITASIKF